MTETYQDYLRRARQRYGASFDPRDLEAAGHFGPYFGTRTRLKVRSEHGHERTGTVGVTGGWRPAFLLMRSSRAIGSSDVLGPGDRIVAIKPAGARAYVPITGNDTLRTRAAEGL